MPHLFNDISFSPKQESPEITAQDQEIVLIQQYLCDLYLQCMRGYKPPYCTRVVIQPLDQAGPALIKQIGSLFTITSSFDNAAFQLAAAEKYGYLLNLIQSAMLQLAESYHWNRTVFDLAYNEITEKDFTFRFDYPPIRSKNRKNIGALSIEKTITTTTLYANLTIEKELIRAKLFDKINSYCHDCAYVLTRYGVWFDADRFGIQYPKGNITAWYSLKAGRAFCFQDDQPVEKFDFTKAFWLQDDKNATNF